MNYIQSKVEKIILILALLSLTNCTYFKAEQYGKNQGLAIQNPGDAPGGNGDIVPIAGVRTASVQSAGRYLKGLEACTGVQASNQTRNAYGDNAGSLSVDGKANSITAPMLKAAATISAEICNDLISSERDQEPAARRIFSSIDFNQGPSNVSNQAIGDVVRRLARSCWGRNETAEELKMIRTSATSDFEGNDRGQTQLQMVYVCGSVLASLSAMEM